MAFLKKILRKIYYIFENMFVSKIDKSVHFTGKKYISFGKYTMISQNTWLNVNKRGGKRIILGEYDFIGRNNFFTSGNLIEFGDFVLTSVNCCFIGANHNYEMPIKPYIFGSAISDQIIKIEDNCFIGANVTIMGNVSIGRGSLIGVNSFIRNMDIPPFSVVVGADKPRITKRYSFATNTWKKIDDWTELDENAIPTKEKYKEMIYAELKDKYNNSLPLPLKAVGKSNGDLYL